MPHAAAAGVPMSGVYDQIVKELAIAFPADFLTLTMPEIALQVARVIGMSLSSVATAVVDAGAARSEERREAEAIGEATGDAEEGAGSLAVRSGELLPFVSEVIDYSFRRHLRAATRRRVVLASAEVGEVQVIGFADLVRFSELSLHLDDRTTAEAQGLVRVVDESGEDYLFPKDYFVPIELSGPIQNRIAQQV